MRSFSESSSHIHIHMNLNIKNSYFDTKCHYNAPVSAYFGKGVRKVEMTIYHILVWTR